MASTPRTYWSIIQQDRRTRWIPIATLITLILCCGTFYLAPSQDTWYAARPVPDWFDALIAATSHVSTTHLWTNMGMLLVAGMFFEFTEGPFRTIAVLYAGLFVGFLIHGLAKPTVRIRGLSGAIYGLVWAQVGLLLLNWHEMPWRYVRVFVSLTLLNLDLGFYLLDLSPGISYESHAFGAVGGICAALCLGQNVRVHRYEKWFAWMGVVAFAIFTIVAAASNQHAIGGFLFIQVIVCFQYSLWQTRCTDRAQTSTTHIPPTVPHTTSHVRTSV
jgi:membrane associated rhomboid family serine protease